MEAVTIASFESGMSRFGAFFCLAMMACSRPSISLSDLDREVQQARCEHLVRCKLLPDEASCLATTRPTPNPSRDAAVAAHKITYDAEQARACVDATANQACDLAAHDAHVPPAACSAMLSGHVADGDSCSIDTECASGTCVRPTECPDTGCCVGQCRATQQPAAAGDACNKARDCRAGLVCGEDLTCHAPVGEGQSCRSDRECIDGLACVGVTDMPGICHTLPQAGERCPFQQCASENQRCDAMTNTCITVGLPGAPCTTSFDCSIYTECDATSHLCREFPRLGMPCDGTCIDDSFCMLDSSGPIGTCVALLPDNSPCAGDNSCVSGYCPDGPIFRSCVELPVCF
jgi:hypothetical protein